MLSLHSPLHTIPVVRDIHLFRNAGYSIRNVPKREKKIKTLFFLPSLPIPNTEHFNNALVNNDQHTQIYSQQLYMYFPHAGSA